jgi:flagellar hook protein FlgE
MGFQQGLSGLNAAAKSLDVIGNNIANASTVGFKQSQAQFADVYASSLAGSSGGQAGIGVQVATIAQLFGQGNITTTNNSLDMAISNSGFFRMSNNGSITYTRNGQFQLDRTGYIVSSQGYRLTGYLPNALGVIVPTAPSEIQISTADLLPNATTEVAAGLNLNANSTIIAAAFDPTLPATFNNSTSTTVYDSLGGSHVASLYFAKTGANAWNAFLTVDGVNTQGAGVALTGMTFNTNGTLATPAAAVTATGFPIAGANNLVLNIDFADTSQFGSSFGVNSMSQDGYTSGHMTGFSTGADGMIAGRYSNGQTRTLGQVVLANFSNPQGLQPLGANNWAETATSGTPLVGTPGSASLGVLKTSAVEDSNVDLTAELVNMITAQRVYQANAQTIKTQDSVLQTLVNMR